MEKRKMLIRELPVLAILLAPLIYLLVVWDRLPDRLPMHWNLAGEIDSYGPKYAPALLSVGMYLLLLVLPCIDPRKRNYDLFSSTYYKLRIILMIFTGGIVAVILSAALGMAVNQERVILIGVAFLFTALGNYMGTLKPNWFIGIRVPWTLDSEAVWRKTHRLAGRIWFWSGLALLALSFTLPLPVFRPVLFGAVLFMSAVPVIYSYVMYRKEK